MMFQYGCRVIIRTQQGSLMPLNSLCNSLHHTAAFARVPEGEETRLNYGLLASNGSNVKVVNNGHTVQVVSGHLLQSVPRQAAAGLRSSL
jgi:hypothetical protein